VKTPKALSLFSGAGGMDIGVTRAGFNVLASIEIDPNCCSTLRHNIDRDRVDTLVIESDVREVDPRQLMKELRLKSGELDLLFGGPPCQTFSQIGKKQGIEDDRGLLLFEMTRFAKTFKPKTILIENVKGLLSAAGPRGARGGVLNLLNRELARLGYHAKWQVINAANFGAPQLRERVFIVATHGANGFMFPTPTHADSTLSNDLFGFSPFVTVGDVLKGLPSAHPKSIVLPKDSHMDVTPKGDRSRISGVPEGAHLSAQSHLPAAQIGGLTRKDTTKFLRVSRKKPSNTLRCGEIFFHPTEDRYLTPREYMRIHGYPDDYELLGPIRGRSGSVRNLDQHRQVANSVPPPVALAIASQIRDYLSANNL
jgi:DNA (cytosine-5)-methyltransferase 1